MGIAPTDVEQEVKPVDIVVSKADAEGNITYGNPIFMKLSGYTQGELLDQPHSLLRHPDMPKVVFKYLWDNIKEGKDVKAFVKNLAKDGFWHMLKLLPILMDHLETIHPQEEECQNLLVRS